MTTTLPPLPEEGHVCSDCGVDYGATAVPEGLAVIRGVPDRARPLVLPLSDAAVRTRPSEKTWSVIEYLCHLRDVYAVYTIRLYRTRVEDRPVLEPMLNDLRVVRFRYRDRDPVAVLDELSANVAGFCDEAARVRDADWERVATRLPGEARTARWLVRQAMHEGTHHLGDIVRIAG